MYLGTMQNGSVERVQKTVGFHLVFEVPGNYAKRFRGDGAKTIGFHLVFEVPGDDVKLLVFDCDFHGNPNSQR